MRGQANLIREFIEKVDWVIPENISFFLYGKSTGVLNSDADWIMTQMITNKDRTKRLKLLDNEMGKRIFALYSNPNSTKGLRNLNHDIKLRNVLALMKPDKCVMSNYKGADAEIEINDNKFYLEFDNGYEQPEEWEKKIKTYYSERGIYNVIFILAQKPKGDTEKSRFDKLFKIVESSLKFKKGRVLGAMYSQYLIDQKLYNWRMEEKCRN